MLHEQFLQQRYPPNYRQTEHLPRLDDPSGHSSLMPEGVGMTTLLVQIFY